MDSQRVKAIRTFQIRPLNHRRLFSRQDAKFGNLFFLTLRLSVLARDIPNELFSFVLFVPFVVMTNSRQTLIRARQPGDDHPFAGAGDFEIARRVEENHRARVFVHS